MILNVGFDEGAGLLGFASFFMMGTTAAKMLGDIVRDSMFYCLLDIMYVIYSI